MKTSIIKNNYIRIFGVLLWFIIWAILSLVINNDSMLPSPIQTLIALSELIFDEKFIKSIFYTLFRVFFGFSISVIIGVFLGVISGINKIIFTILNPLIITIKSTPVISIILIVILWTKSGNVPIIIAFLMTFPMIFTNTVTGINATDKKLLEMARSFNISKKSIIKNIYLPSIRPFLLSAITYGVGISWKVTVAAEVLSHPRFAIGSRLYESKLYLDVDEVFAWTTIVVFLSFIFEYVIKYWIDKLGEKVKYD